MSDNILQVARRYMPLVSAERSYKWQCPFHDGNDESFYVFPERNRWRCFGPCDAGGDADSFKARIEALLEQESGQAAMRA